jgi:GH25 family lysozyme M1 (1,4-beta-N-acetylmuramidase)
MYDFSDNNAGRVNWKEIYASGTRRIYLKRGGSEGRAASFADPTFVPRLNAARKVGLEVGPYYFHEPRRHSPKEEMDAVLGLLAHHHPKLLPLAMDVEWGTADKAAGAWVWEFATLWKHHVGHLPIFYSYYSFAQDLELPDAAAEMPLWLAGYGRDDGKEYPYTVPHPWRRATAHQYTTKARVRGITGTVDLTHVLDGTAFDSRIW